MRRAARTTIVVRTGFGCVRQSLDDFTDRIETIERTPFRDDWNQETVKYKHKAYRLQGGGATPFHICLNQALNKGARR